MKTSRHEPSNASNGTGTTRTTLFGYTPGGLLTLLTSINPDTGTQITRWDYGVTIGQGSALDSNSLLREKIEPDGNGQGVTYVYNRQGQPTTMIDSNGTTHAFTHDKLGALLADTVTEFGAGVATTVARLENAYNERRLPVRATSLDGAGAVVNEVAWIYNKFNQAVKERQAHGGAAGSGSPEVQYNYAGGGTNTIRPTGLTYPDGTPVTISYTSAMADALSRPDHLKLGATTVAEWAYLGLGTMVRRAYPAAGGAFFTLGSAPAGYPGMDRFGRLARTLWQKGSDTLVDTQYGRNRSGAVIWRRDALAHSLSVTNQDNYYWYDGLHQVTRHDRGGLVPSSGPPYTGVDPITRAQHETFAFDQTGNWNAYTAQSPVLGQWRAHNEANEITAITGPTGVVQPTYDPVGNMTTFPTPNDWDTAMVATWDAWNRLVSTGVGTTVTTYAYDALSRRIKTVAAGVTRDTYYNNQWRAIEERLGGMIAARYVWNPMDRWDMILRERPAATETLYVLRDYLDPVAIINTSGTVVERYGYDAFGPVRFMEADYSARATSAHDWNFLFHAEFTDAATGLYNYGYRYYHPQLGRWLSRDPIGERGGVNLYGFVGNSGPASIDVLGLADTQYHHWMPVGLKEDINGICPGFKINLITTPYGPKIASVGTPHNKIHHAAETIYNAAYNAMLNSLQSVDARYRCCALLMGTEVIKNAVHLWLTTLFPNNKWVPTGATPPLWYYPWASANFATRRTDDEWRNEVIARCACVPSDELDEILKRIRIPLQIPIRLQVPDYLVPENRYPNPIEVVPLLPLVAKPLVPAAGGIGAGEAAVLIGQGILGMVAQFGLGLFDLGQMYYDPNNPPEA